MFAAFCTGFDSMIAATLNFAHKEIFEIQKKTQEGDNEGARRLQNKITDLIYFLVPEGKYTLVVCTLHNYDRI